MRKLKIKTVNESPDLVKYSLNNHNTLKNMSEKILEDILGTIESSVRIENDINSLKQILIEYLNKDDKDHPSNPTKFSEDIKDYGEKAYQRAIIKSITKLNTIGTVEWKDIELPVVLGKMPRRTSIDLIGSLSDGTPILCELKFTQGKNPSNSPIYAAIELMIYYYLITVNYKKLQSNKIFHKNGKNFNWEDLINNPKLIVAANKTYWTHWELKYEKLKIDFNIWKNSLPIEVHFFSSEDYKFHEQKEKTKDEKGKYKPTIGHETEWIEKYIK